MGGVKFRTISDLGKMDAHLGITCNGCGHQVVMQRQGVEQYFLSRSWNTTLEAAGARFRCRKCGHRGASLRAVQLNERERAPVPKVLWER
jgi:DNA-directed RNA polymerase subunit RPC12/RpoP